MPSKEQGSRIESSWGLPTGGRRDKDVRIVQRFEALTGIRLRSPTVAALPREFLGRQIAPPDEMARRHRFHLQPRTYNALRQHAPATEGGYWTYGRLLEIRGFGLFSLLDLLEVLARGEGEPCHFD
jgi:hypothetical protein